jgi:hypothetical protein
MVVALLRSVKRIVEAAQQVPKELQRHRDQSKDLERQIENLLALAANSKSPALAEKLEAMEFEQKTLQAQIADGEEVAALQKLEVPDESWVNEQLKDLSEVIHNDPEANRLIKDLIGEVTAREIIPPGKVRGYLQLSFRLDGNKILGACLKKTLRPALLNKLIAVTDDGCGDVITIDVERETVMSRVCPVIHEFRKKGMPWREIAKHVDTPIDVAAALYSVWVKRQKPAV